MTMESPKNSTTDDDSSGIMHAEQDAAVQTSPEDGVNSMGEATPEYGIFGFTLRELLIVGAWLVAFVFSFFPLIGEQSIWMINIQWLLPIGLPTAAVFLLVLRRFSPDGIRRVGSLGIDQFASVVFSVSAVLWVGMLWSAVSSQIQYGAWTLGWSGIVQLIAALALVVLSVFAPLVPALGQDFQGRPTTPAHRNANPVHPVIARPRPVRPVPVPAPAPAEDMAEVASEVAASDGYPSAVPDAPRAFPASGLDAELSGEQATDEVTRLDLAAQVPLVAHASGGGTGTADTTADEEYVPSYSRRSRSQEIVSDTASIEALVTPEPDAETDEGPSPVWGDAVAEEAVVSADVLPEDDTLLGDDAAEGDVRETFPEVAAAEDTPTYAAVAEDFIAEEPAAPEEATSWEDTAQDTPSQETPFLEAAPPAAARRESVVPEASSRGPASHDEGFAPQPFWILTSYERDVHDERGEPLFRIGPTAWALVIEDRGGAFVVRHDDGRIGYLHDVSDITKG